MNPTPETRYRAVLFDLDGTYADTAPDLAAAVNRMRIDRGMVPMGLAELRPMASHGARGLLGVGFGIEPSHADYPDMVAEFLHNYAQAICVHTRVYPGVDTLVRALDARGVPWGIVTNKVEALALRLLGELAPSPAPRVVVGGDTAPRPKPAPDPLWHAASVLGIPAQQCLYLGDDLRDMQAARAAGMGAAAVTYGYSAGDDPSRWDADLILADAADLLDHGLV